METRWTVQLLGQLNACDGEREITRFRTRKTAELLAYLALHRTRTHSRESLLDLLWPDSPLDDARNSLSVALNSLRRQFEPPGTPAGAFLIADRTSVRLHANACTTDVGKLEAAMECAIATSDAAQGIAHLNTAVALYFGDFLPGHDADWVFTQRQRLRALYWTGLRRLVKELAAQRAFDRALDFAHRAAQLDPLHEGATRDLMRLYAALGQPAAALDAYRHLEEHLRDLLHTAPSGATRELAQELEGKGIGYGASDVEGGKREKTIEKSAVSSAQPPAPDAPLPQPQGLRSLPQQITRFFGRETELAELEARLRPDAAPPARLLTLTGAGGCGKTRLATELARRLQAEYSGAVWFVPLADCSDPARLPAEIRDALRLPPAADTDPLDQIAAFFGPRPFLLILDNMEQLLEPPPLDRRRSWFDERSGAVVVQELLARAPELRCLVTSRRVLDIGGEQEYPVLPLATPQGAVAPEQLMQNPSAQLFVDRAQSRRVDFQITAHNASAVATLCDHLEGIPLALELAAGWAKTLTPAQMVSQLQQRFDFLTSRRHDLPSRHRTLRAAVEWSYCLLPLELRTFFARLAVFRGGCTIEAAHSVCEEPYALDYLALLRDSSLLLAEERDDAMRFRMLETIREYALDALKEAGECIATQDRHAAYFLDWLIPTSQKLLAGGDTADAMHQLTLEIENLRSGMDWRAQQGDAAGVVAYGLALTRYLVKRSLYAECETRMAVAQEAARQIGDSKSLASLLNWHGLIAWDRSEYVLARGYFQESYAMSKTAGETQIALAALINLGNIAWGQSEFDAARQVWEEALELAETLQQPMRIANLCNDLGLVASLRGDYAASEAYFARGLATYRSEGLQEGIATSLYNHAELLWQQDKREEALAQSETAQGLYEAIEMPRGVALTRAQQAYFLFQSGKVEAARQAAEESLALSEEIGLQIGSMYALDALARVSGAQGDVETARERFRQSGALACTLGDRQHQADVLRHYGEMLSAFPDAIETAFLAFSIAAREYTALQMPEAVALHARMEALQDRIAPSIRRKLEVQAREKRLPDLLPPPPQNKRAS